MSIYKWIHLPDKLTGPREGFYDVGILPDGTLHNPRGYPEDQVRAAVLAVDERRTQRRSESAKKAAKTRQRRQERQIYAVAKQIVEKALFYGPRTNCFICGRHLDDPASIERGIGSECWQHVLVRVQIFKIHPDEVITLERMGIMLAESKPQDMAAPATADLPF